MGTNLNRGRGGMSTWGSPMSRGGGGVTRRRPGGKRPANYNGTAPGGKRRRLGSDNNSFGMWGDQPIAQQPLDDSNEWF